MKAMKVANEDARVEYGPEYIRVKITGFHGSPEQATQLIDEIPVDPIDRGVARKLVQDWDQFREPIARQTYIGTRVSVDRL